MFLFGWITRKLGSLYVQHWYIVSLITLAHLRMQGWIKHWREEKKNFRLHKTKLFNLLKRTLTLLTYFGYSGLDSLGFLNVENRVKQLRLNHIFKIFNGTYPSYLLEHFHKVSDFHMYNTSGSSKNFFVPHPSGYASTTFFFNGINDWNYLQDTKRVETFNRFKTSVKRFLNSQMQIMKAFSFLIYCFLFVFFFVFFFFVFFVTLLSDFCYMMYNLETRKVI